MSDEQQQPRNTTDFSVPVDTDLADLFAMRSDPFTEAVSVFDQNLADLSDYDDTIVDRNGARSNEQYNINQLYAGLPMKDEPLDIFDDHELDLRQSFSENDDEVAAFTLAGTSGANNRNQIRDMLRQFESPTVNLTRVIEWSNYFANATKTEKVDEDEVKVNTTEQQIETNNLRNVRVKLESEGDDDDRAGSPAYDDSKNSTSGFSSNVELTEEVTQSIIFFLTYDLKQN